MPNFSPVYEGDCWMIHDEKYSKKSHIIPNHDVKTICFDRPCIVLSSAKDLVTVIPLTSKETNQYEKYPIQIEEGRHSYALLAQVTTIERRKLTVFIGKIKSNILDDIRKNLFSLMEDKKGTVERHVNQRFNDLDIHRFYTFHIYQMAKAQYTFMAIRCSSNKFIEIPLILPWNKEARKENEVYYDTICGTLNLTRSRILSYNKYNENIIDLGYEWRKNIQDKVIEYLLNEFHTKIRIPGYQDHKLNFSSGIFYFFGMKNYFTGYYKIMSIRENSEKQEKFFTNPKAIVKFRDRLNHQYNDYKAVELLQIDMLHHLNPLESSLKCLEYLKRKNEELLHNLLLPYKSAMNLDTKSNMTRQFDGTKIYTHYQVKNLKWIYSYFKSLQKKNEV